MSIRTMVFVLAIVCSGAWARADGRATPGLRSFDAGQVPLDRGRLPPRVGNALARAETLLGRLAPGLKGRPLAQVGREVDELGVHFEQAARAAARLTPDQRAMSASGTGRLIDALKRLDGVSVAAARQPLALRRLRDGLTRINRFLRASHQDPLHVALVEKDGVWTLTAREVYDVDPRAYQRGIQGGSRPVPGAPSVRLPDGSLDVPDAARVNNWDKRSLTSLVARVAYRDELPLFVGSDRGRPYLQVGVIGPDNYPSGARHQPDMIVYGRRWYIPSYIPRSEVLQTVLKAVADAEEHENREKLTWANPARDGRRTTHGNTHVDAPLYVQWKKAGGAAVPNPTVRTRADVARVLAELRYAGRPITLTSLSTLPGGRLALTVKIGSRPAGLRAELFDDRELTFLTEAPTASDVAFGVLDEIVRVTRRHVEDHLTFDGETRFNRATDTFQRIGTFVGQSWARDQKTAAHPDHGRVDELLYRSRYEWMTPQGAPPAGSIMKKGANGYEPSP